MRKKHILITLLLSFSLFIVLGVKYIMGTKDEFFYPTIVNSIPPVNESLPAILTEFKAVLKEKNKAAHDALNPGLTAEGIRKLEEEYQVKLPEEIVTLYMWHNGSSSFEKRSTYGDIVPGHWFVPLKEALEQNKSLKQPDGTVVQKAAYELFAGHRKTWIVLFDDGCGDGYFYDPVQKTGSGYVFYHFAEMRYYVFFSSLKNLFRTFDECYREDIYTLDNTKNYENFEKAAKVMAKYGISVN